MPKHKAGYIYLIHRADNWYKIGRTANLEQRMGSHRWVYGRKHKLMLLCLVKVDNQVVAEHLFQRIFNSKRTTKRHRGMGPCHEWFLLSDADLLKWANWADVIGSEVVYVTICLTDKDWLTQLRSVFDG